MYCTTVKNVSMFYSHYVLRPIKKHNILKASNKMCIFLFGNNWDNLRATEFLKEVGCSKPPLRIPVALFLANFIYNLFEFCKFF